MKKKTYISLLFGLCLTVQLPSIADNNCKSFRLAGRGISVKDATVTREGGFLTLNMLLNLDSLRMPANTQLVYTPVVKGDGQRIEMPEIVINGRRQQIMYERGVGGSFSKDALVVKRNGKKPQTLTYKATVPYSSSEYNYKVEIEEDLCGCGDSLDSNHYPLFERHRPILAFTRPAAEAIKERHIDKKAYIDFPVDKIALNPNYRRNPAELDSIISTINLVKNDKNLTVSNINIHGYASPESPYEHNDYLASNRAKTLKDYVRRLVNLDDKLFTVSHTAEDWDGLRKYISESNLEHKSEILAIANDETLTPDVREWRIKLKYNDEYKYMLTNWYPALRHSDYHINYTVKPFDVDEAKRVIKTKPQQLSQQEMYLVAQTYEPGSKDFNEVMEIAVRMYPDDATANLNAACTRLNALDADGAKPYLDKAGNSPQAVNARAAYYALKGNYTEARKLFKEAADAGVKEAEENLQNL